jgi:hypothetical protein
MKEGPQEVTNHGEQAIVILSFALYQELNRPKNLFNIFLILYKQLFFKIIVGVLCPIAILAILIVNSLTKLSLFWNLREEKHVLGQSTCMM